MAKSKTVRLQLPKAKLLKFNRNGKSIPTPAPQRDWVAEKCWMLRPMYSDEIWAIIRPHLAAAIERVDRAKRNGGTAS